MTRLARGRGRAINAMLGGGGAVPPQVLQLFGTPVLTGIENTSYSTWQVSAIGGTAPYSFALTGTYPAGISIDSVTGVISGTPTEDGTFTGLNVEVTDNVAATDSLDSNFTITVGAELAITAVPVTTAWQNEAYTGFDADASGGTGGYVFSIVGTLPTGISINSSTGVVSGTPTGFGSFSGLTVRVTDSSGAFRDSSTFTIDVGQQLAISGTPVTSGTEGVAYTGFTASGIGGDGSYTYSLRGTWPTGISIDSSTGIVSGTPSQNGAFTGLSVRVTDGRAKTADLSTFTLTLAAAPTNFSITDTISDGTDLTSGKSRTYTGKSIGSTAADRIVVFAMQFTQAHNGRTIPVVTCDGVEMMCAATSERGINQTPTQIYAIPKATGTTADFAIQFDTPDTNANVPRVAAAICRIVGMSLVPSGFIGDSDASFPSASAITLDVNTEVDNGGIIIAIGGGDTSGTPTNEAWTGVTKDQTLTIETLRTTIAHREATATEAPRTINYVIGGGVNTFAPSACSVAFAPTGTARELVWDTFDRSAADLDASPVPYFTTQGNWQWDSRTPHIVINSSGKLDNNNTNGPGTVYHFDLGSAAHWAEWWTENTSASNGPFVAVRIVDYDNFVGVRVAGVNVEIYRREASSMNNIANNNVSVALGTLFRLEAEGTALRLFRNGELTNTYTLASPFVTPTKVGIVGRSTVLTNFLARFRCGTL
jgi:hypothetical protein